MRAALIAVLLAACAPGASAPTEPEAVVAPPLSIDPVGHYLGGEICLSWPWVTTLHLDADGRYEGKVLNGITFDGCGTFEGAGSSRGRWSERDGIVRFRPDAAEDLAVDFGSATAQATHASLVLTEAGRSWVLRRAVR